MLARGYTVTEQAQHTEGAALRLYTNEAPTLRTQYFKITRYRDQCGVCESLKYGRER